MQPIPEPVERPPRIARSGGGLTYAQGPHVTYGEKFSGRVQMYDGCCSVR